jgi:hypothetical protein
MYLRDRVFRGQTCGPPFSRPQKLVHGQLRFPTQRYGQKNRTYCSSQVDLSHRQATAEDSQRDLRVYQVGLQADGKGILSSLRLPIGSTDRSCSVLLIYPTSTSKLGTLVATRSSSCARTSNASGTILARSLATNTSSPLPSLTSVSCYVLTKRMYKPFTLRAFKTSISV